MKVATNYKPPSYDSIFTVQTELNKNNMSIDSILGGGSHSHIFLTLAAANLLTETVTAYISQVAPTVSPFHKANATGSQITETIRQWTEYHRTFNINQDVVQELFIQVIASNPAVYLRCHYSAMIGWENFTILEMLTTLCTNYGTITSIELYQNILHI